MLVVKCFLMKNISFVACQQTTLVKYQQYLDVKKRKKFQIFNLDLYNKLMLLFFINR